MMEKSEFWRFTEDLAHASAQVILPYFSDPDLEVVAKADNSPVTIADRNAEQRMREMIAERYPRHGVIGEEFGEHQTDAEYVWVLDPIDGTKSFTAGVPLFGTLICLLHHGQPLVGAIHGPAAGQLVIGDNTTTLLNDKPVHVRKPANLAACQLVTTDFENPNQFQNPVGWERLTAAVGTMRTWGDCYGYLLLACGWIDISLDPIMNFWDLAALIPVVRGAGGTITDWHGDDPVAGTSIVAAHPDIHCDVIGMLNTG